MSKKRTRFKENPEFFGMVRRMIRAAGRRAGEGDEHDLKELLLLAGEVETALREAIKAQMTEQNRSWAFIGDALVMTRQAAHKRFSG